MYIVSFEQKNRRGTNSAKGLSCILYHKFYQIAIACGKKMCLGTGFFLMLFRKFQLNDIILHYLRWVIRGVFCLRRQNGEDMIFCRIERSFCPFSRRKSENSTSKSAFLGEFFSQSLYLCEKMVFKQFHITYIERKNNIPQGILYSYKQEDEDEGKA